MRENRILPTLRDNSIRRPCLQLLNLPHQRLKGDLINYRYASSRQHAEAAHVASDYGIGGSRELLRMLLPFHGYLVRGWWEKAGSRETSRFAKRSASVTHLLKERSG
jgi:hypothetical protein